MEASPSSGPPHLFNALEQLHVVLRHKRDGTAASSRTRRSAHTVNVVLKVRASGGGCVGQYDTNIVQHASHISAFKFGRHIHNQRRGAAYLGMLRNFKVDDNVDVGNVKATGRHVGGDKDVVRL